MPNAQHLSGRTALITGVTSGIGRALATEMTGRGAHVIGTGRRGDRLSALGAALGGAFHGLVLDMRDRAALASIEDRFPAGVVPDILVNNAGLALGLGGADQADLNQWDEMVETNILGLIHLTRAMLPLLKQQPRADIMNVSSVAGTYPYPGGNTYGGTKAFVTQFSLNLRADLLGSQVRVTSIEPGMTETEFSTVRFSGDTAKAADVYRDTTPLTAEDIAKIMADILSYPPHINVNRIEIMPVDQAFGAFPVNRG